MLTYARADQMAYTETRQLFNVGNSLFTSDSLPLPKMSATYIMDTAERTITPQSLYDWALSKRSNDIIINRLDDKERARNVVSAYLNDRIKQRLFPYPYVAGAEASNYGPGGFYLFNLITEGEFAGTNDYYYLGEFLHKSYVHNTSLYHILREIDGFIQRHSGLLSAFELARLLIDLARVDDTRFSQLRLKGI